MGHHSYSAAYLEDTIVHVAKHLGYPPKRTIINGRHCWHPETLFAADALGIKMPALETYRNRLGSIPEAIERALSKVDWQGGTKSVKTDLDETLRELLERTKRIEAHLGVVS